MYFKKFLFIVGIIVYFSLPTLASNQRKDGTIINFNQELNRDSISKRCDSFANTPREIDYLKKLYALSIKKDSVNLQCVILSGMIKNYYNRSNIDSVRYWFKKLEKVSLKEKQYRQFFDSYNLLCSIELYSQNYDIALENTNRLYILAKELKNADGIIASYENMGIIYMETFRYVEAIKAFNEGLALQKKQKDKRHGYQFQFTSYIIESYLKLKDYKNVLNSINGSKKILQEWKKISSNIPYNRCFWLLNCYNIEMYVGLKKPDLAAKYIDDSQKYISGVNDEFVCQYFHYVSALYYQLTKNYSKALENIDSILSFTNYLPALQLKGKLLLESGRYKEAALVYDAAVNEIGTTYNENLSKQMNQLRTIHEVDKLELRNKELEIASRTLKLKIVFVFALFFLAIAVASFIYIIRIRRIRNQLRHSDKMLKEDKKKLIKSERELIIARDKAEKSSKYKDIFLANMSHEVRTPLNAIVGFSNLITDMHTEVGSRQYVNIIRYNTDLLLKLINDTVDAASLQTGQLPFNFETCEIKSFCLSLIDDMKLKPKEGVKLHFVPSSANEFYLTTDEIRLKQLLCNLLLNAIKFTDSGDIYLKYDIDKEAQNITFTVEDTGKGIPEDMQKVIFESFEKINLFNQGLGLGLTLVKLIADNLDGKVMIDSSYTGGTRILFIHPIK